MKTIFNILSAMTTLTSTLSQNIDAFGKYLDQPAVLRNLRKTVPLAAGAAAVGYGIYDVYKAPEKEKKKTAVRDFLVMGSALGAGFLAVRGFKIGKKKIPGLDDLHDKIHKHKHGPGCGHHHHEHDYHSPIDEVMEKLTNAGKDTLAGFVKKIHDKEYLKIGEVFQLHRGLQEVAPKKRLIADVIPDSHAHDFKETMKELGYLTGIGLIPVVGGISGGMLADKINGEDVKEKSKNKLKEGFFQYAANITLCNLGAGVALLAMGDRVKNKGLRLAGMMAGVIGVGIVFGGTIANFVGKNFINPVIDKGLDKTLEDYNRQDHHFKHMFKDVNSERKPEPLDVALHIDDVASVGFLSGMKWIGPILPALYSISGYRAGIGYRNGPESEHDKKQHHFDFNRKYHFEHFKNFEESNK